MNIIGTSQKDILKGTTGLDLLQGLGGDDLLQGLAGDDVLQGGSGGDRLEGGLGNDRATYLSAQEGVTAVLGAAYLNTGDAKGDSYFDIEGLIGSNFDDNLTGDHGANTLDGRDGNDVLFGLDGNDRLLGGAGNDRLLGGSGADLLDGGSGSDTASYSSATGGVVARLANAALNLGEAKGDSYVSIENLTGSGFADTLGGDAGANILAGNAGADALSGEGGNDVLEGGQGADTLNGGSGVDTASYEHAIAGVQALLGSPAFNTGDAAGDSYVSIEHLRGSAFVDTLAGDAWNNTLQGLAGNDTLYGNNGDDILIGGQGADALYGGDGSDTAVYAEGDALLLVDLLDTSKNGGAASGDVFHSIENLTGGSGQDALRGTAEANILSGGAGNDSLLGRAGGDVLIGGAGTDTADYWDYSFGLTANLEDASQNTGHAQGDSYYSIENIYAGNGNDVLTGNAAVNDIRASGGDDIVFGRAGNDHLKGQDGNDILVGGAGADLLDGGESIFDVASYQDALAGVTASLANAAVNTGDAAGDVYISIDHLTGSAFDDVLIGDSGQNDLMGGAGADLLQGGGSGYDAASYANALAGVTASLAKPATNTGDAKGDVYVDISGLVGTAFDDTLTGNGSNNIIAGGHGDNILSGGAGDDMLLSGDGTDILAGGAGNDSLYGGNGRDTADYSNSASAVVGNLTAGTVTGEGTDSLDSIENLRGSNFADTLTGDSSYNALFGGGGNDLLAGGGDALDGGSGIDTVTYAAATTGAVANLGQASLNQGAAFYDSYISIENMAGSAFADTLTGNATANAIAGGGGADRLSGGLGADALTGNAGADSFVFDSKLGAGNIDAITDFSVVNDSIALDHMIFLALDAGPLAAGEFRIGSAAADANDHILYNATTGTLSYDADGNGAGAQVVFATLATGLAMTSADIAIF